MTGNGNFQFVVVCRNFMRNSDTSWVWQRDPVTSSFICDFNSLILFDGTLLLLHPTVALAWNVYRAAAGSPARVSSADHGQAEAHQPIMFWKVWPPVERSRAWRPASVCWRGKWLRSALVQTTMWSTSPPPSLSFPTLTNESFRLTLGSAPTSSWKDSHSETTTDITCFCYHSNQLDIPCMMYSIREDLALKRLLYNEFRIMFFTFWLVLSFWHGREMSSTGFLFIESNSRTVAYCSFCWLQLSVKEEERDYFLPPSALLNMQVCGCRCVWYLP